MNKKDLIASAVFLVIAVSVYTYASSFPIKEGTVLAMNAGFYPRFISAILGLLSILLMVESLKKKEAPEDCPVPNTTPFYKSRGGFNLLLTIVMLICYPFLLQGLGFASAAFVFILTLIIVLTGDVRKKIPSILLVSLVLTVVMYFIFKVFLRIPFPQGILI
ncbi:tripartite tricarboxylate transporter TctB family protein [Oceanispirochaeta crateris]|uniref:Tripartite tricarboxylate transporter TctB family protein n=1 Tax=Oceanispirochaeta crateris TaxID=2518645 RepID=A0A5C1QJ28_9SPIO|nr:tripartite tricarboxylate transporter TctB family protein [Oceanispirochaeta crateris]QEN08165.1 tripartite tricarboxylate transporter TctB family protein [Oceanispirochaeta crateris]